jgi:hypothetical protein
VVSAVTAEETEFAKILESVGADASSCVTHTYHELAFHHIAGSDADVFAAVNTKPAFFMAMLSGHQTAAFIAMHRLYETEDGHESLSSLMRYARHHPQLFARSALLLRKRNQGLSEEHATEYVQDAFEADERGLAEVREACARAREQYNEQARPIRHKVFAHSGTLRRADRLRFFDELMVRDFEYLAVFPHVLVGAMRNLFDNGHRPDVTMPETNIVRVVTPLEGARTGGRHFHVAKETSEFLTAFTRMTLRDLQERGLYNREEQDEWPPG